MSSPDQFRESMCVNDIMCACINITHSGQYNESAFLAQCDYGNADAITLYMHVDDVN